ncbi:ABC transporter ATP-binding protein [Streptomyces sp. QH1-20]|uniref:ABC transporter ATP-binding protein n=1 Tax=Streptomyces sp. QH1-20 TaxID=3240934 RepID=UPI0035151AD4
MTALAIDSISKRYGDHLALNEMSFTVPAGEIFGFVGSNGAGKSTTMRIAVGVLSADSGTVSWGGEPVTPAIASVFGYMPEERGLYPKMTVAKQLVYLARLHGHSRDAAVSVMERWTERLNIAQHRDRLVDELSLGNQQRVQLAAALVHDPCLLILDEPFSGLDPLAVDDMSEVLKETAAAGVPVLFSSHQLDLVERLCHRVGVVRAGTLVASGTVEELRSDERNSLYVEVEGAPPGWLAEVDGVRTAHPLDEGLLVELADGVHEHLLLEAAMAAGRVRAFRRQQPTLTQMFRSLVADPDLDGERTTE